MKYIRKFNSKAEYDSYVQNIPFTTLCGYMDNNKMNIGISSPETRIICTYYVENPEYQVQLFSFMPQEEEMPLAFESMEIDGIEYNNLSYDDAEKQLSAGTHVVKFTLADTYLTDNKTIIPSYTFKACRELTNIIIPNGIKAIGAEVFGDCDILTTVIFPNTLETIGMYAFWESGLYKTSITLPINVTNIGNSALYGIPSITSLNPIPPTIGQYNLNNTNYIYVPAASVDAYKAASGWSDYASRIQAIPE